METEMNEIINEGKAQMDKAIDHLKYELSIIRTGKASPEMVHELPVEVYGSTTPLKHIANISVTDAKTITIQPWDKSQLKAIEHAIFASNIGITPMNDGEFVRLTVPPLTEERRVLLVKQSKQHGESAKISLRMSRQKLNDTIKKMVKDGYPEDFGKLREKEVDEMLKDYEKNIENLLNKKEEEIMKV